MNTTNWNARPKGASYFERGWVKDYKLPANTTACRAYDLAATERSQVNKHPDFTAGIKMHKDRDGYFYIVGDYHEDFYDETTDAYGRMCKRVGDRDNVIMKQAAYDGDEVTIIFPVDPSAAGKQVYTEMAKKFQGAGFRVKKDPMPTNKSKLTKFLPFADACENGLVRIVKSTFTVATYEALMKELEAFNGERSSDTRKDDYADAIATAYNHLCKAKVHTAFAMPILNNATTQLSSMRNMVKVP